MENHERLKLAGGKHLTVEEHRVVGCHPLHWHSFFELELGDIGDGSRLLYLDDAVELILQFG